MSQGLPSDRSGKAPSDAAPRCHRFWPRPETTLLLISVVGIVGAKFATARSATTRPAVASELPLKDLLPGLANAALADVVFFSSVAVIFALGYVIRPGRFMARLTIVVAALLGAWSVCNAGWLITSGAQLQPSVVTMAMEDVGTTIGLLGHVMEDSARSALVSHTGRWVAVPAIFVGICLVWCCWRLWRPVPVVAERRYHVRRMIAPLGLVIVAGSLRMLHLGGAADAPWKDAISFSSHWHALARTVGNIADTSEIESTRVIPRAGTRVVSLSDTPMDERPNVVIVFLESVSHQVTSLGDPSLETTPNVARLASEGLEFERTYAMVPETSKAWWSSLTSNRPDFLAGAVEAVLVDEPYESLATILARRGYRSAFFEMSRGAWFGAPGFWANVGYDWAWFRENLEDPSAHLAWVNGDDFRMIEPMFEWVDAGDEPFLLTTITSVTHDPYELPDWYEHEPKEDLYDRYLQTIEYSDAFVGAILDELEKRGLTDNTLVCVLGDHGEVFRADSRRGRWVVYEELIRVPWVIHWPGRVPEGTKIKGPCSQLDVTPTILSLLGYGIEDAGFEGQNALEPIDPDRRLFFSSWLGNSPRGYIEGNAKYLYFPYTTTLLVYDLGSDPGELSPTAVEGAEKEAIVARIEEWERGTHIVFPSKRFRERLLFEHWRTFSTGRATNAYYVPSERAETDH